MGYHTRSLHRRLHCRCCSIKEASCRGSLHPPGSAHASNAVASVVSTLDGHSEYSQYSVSAALQVELARRGIGSAYKVFTGTTDEIMIQKANGSAAAASVAARVGTWHALDGMQRGVGRDARRRRQTLRRSPQHNAPCVCRYRRVASRRALNASKGIVVIGAMLCGAIRCPFSEWLLAFWHASLCRSTVHTD
jgi:hypothetical protein